MTYHLANPGDRPGALCGNPGAFATVESVALVNCAACRRAESLASAAESARLVRAGCECGMPLRASGLCIRCDMLPQDA